MARLYDYFVHINEKDEEEVNATLARAKLLRVEEMPPQLIIEAEAATPNESPYIANGSLGAVSFSSILKDVINLKDNELSLLPRELDPLTMYETKEQFFDTIKSNKNVPKYLYELENYLSA